MRWIWFQDMAWAARLPAPLRFQKYGLDGVWETAFSILSVCLLGQHKSAANRSVAEAMASVAAWIQKTRTLTTNPSQCPWQWSHAKWKKTLMFPKASKIFEVKLAAWGGRKLEMPFESFESFEELTSGILPWLQHLQDSCQGDTWGHQPTRVQQILSYQKLSALLTQGMEKLFWISESAFRTNVTFWVSFYSGFDSNIHLSFWQSGLFVVCLHWIRGQTHGASYKSVGQPFWSLTGKHWASE